MKVLCIGALLAACAVLATARPSPQQPESDMTQALLQTMGREESYKMALIQTISELLDMKQEQAEAEQDPYVQDGYAFEQEEDKDENEGGLIWNTGHGPGENNEAELETDKLSMQGILELIGKLQEEDQAKEEGYGQSQDQLENEVEDEQLPLEDIEAQETDKMSIQDILELIGKLQEEDQAKEEDEWEAREQVPTKEARKEVAEIQTPNKTDLEIILEMLNQLKGEEKAQEQGFDSIGHSEREGAEMQEKETMSLEDILNLLDQVEEEQADGSSRREEVEEQDDSSRRNEVEEQDDSSRRDEVEEQDDSSRRDEEQDKEAILEGLSEKLDELQATLQSINKLVNMERLGN